jgi:hypothetical protein
LPLSVGRGTASTASDHDLLGRITCGKDLTEVTSGPGMKT